MRRGQNSPADKSLKRPGREPWNVRKDIKVTLIIKAFTTGLAPEVICRLLIEVIRNAYNYSKLPTSQEVLSHVCK